jgi:cobalt-zinc-cadmium efflux system outer membrane protein
LSDALRAAWQNHPTYRAAEAQLAAAQARRDAASRPLYNPALVFDAENQVFDKSATGGVELTLDVNGKRRAREEAATARVDEATARARLQRRDFARNWLTSWADWVTATERVRTGERRIALVSRFAEVAAKQYAADDISGLDRDLAMLARDEAEAGQASLVAEQATAAASFRSFGGALDAPALASIPNVSLPMPDVMQGGDANPELEIAEAAARAAEREIEVARRNRLADPTVGVRGGRIEVEGFRENIVGVSLIIPLNIRNTYRAEVVAAEADSAAAYADADRIRIELDAEQRRATESYAAAQSAWTRWKGSRGTDVEQRASLLERLWREGELSTTDYLLQLRQTLDTELARAELQARVWRTYADYLAATGQLERWTGLERTP